MHDVPSSDLFLRRTDASVLYKGGIERSIWVDGNIDLSLSTI